MNRLLEAYDQGASTLEKAAIYEKETSSSSFLENLSPTALSVDTTNLCNLKCKHCFWYSNKGHLSIASNKNLLGSVINILDKYPSITNITWYGGEPLISEETRKLLENGILFRKNNLIMTNGTFPIPDTYKNTHYGVSIDGTREIYHELRGIDAYDKIRENIFAAVSRDVRVFVLYCINAINIDCIPDFLEEWNNTGIAGIGFTVYTPIRGKPTYLALSDSQRDEIVSLLNCMKKEYGHFITNSETMIELIRAKYGEELAKNCPMNTFNRCGKIYSMHMCNDGSIRVPCALGKDAAHIECRSITKVALYAGKVLRDRESFRALLRMYISKPDRKRKC